MPVRALTAAPVFRFDEFEVDIAAFELRRGGVPVPMEPQVFEVLSVLVENAGRVVTKDELFDRVWPERYVTEAALNSRVMTARKALGDSGRDQRYIKTVHGRGYRFACGVDCTTASAGVSALLRPGAETDARIPGAGAFFGREAEIERLMALLEDPSSRLVAIVGHGGMGKTRLACEVARRIRDAGRNALFVPLEHTSPDMLGPALATAVGVQPGGDDVVARVAGVLRGRPAVLVLDNIEHLLEAARPTIETILEAAPETRILVTSRSTLGLRQEWVFRIEGLSLEEADGRSDAGRLFFARAAQANAGGSPADALAVETICRMVEGMPLAIELAASLTRYLPLHEIQALIERDARELTADIHDVPDRHRGIDALFEESTRRLEEGEREALFALAVFAGPFDAEAASVVAGISLSRLRSLVDRSLVLPREGAFALHPLMRQLAVAHLGERRPAIERAHAEYFAAFTAGLTPALQGRGQLDAVRRLGAVDTNVFEAWRWACRNGRADLMGAMRRGMFSFLTFRGRFLEADDLARAGLESAAAAADPALHAGLLVSHFWVAKRIGKVARAIEGVQQALSIARAEQLPWQPGYGGDVRSAITALHIGAGRYTEAFASARAALDLAVEAGDRPGTAFMAWLAGTALLRQARYTCDKRPGGGWKYTPMAGDRTVAEASRYIEQAAAVLEPLEETWLRGYVEIERGLAAGGSGEHERGCRHFRTAYELRRDINDPQGMSSALVYLADTLGDLNDLDGAIEAQREARALLAQTADATGIAEILRSEGIVRAIRGSLAEGKQLLSESLRLSESLGFANNVVGALRALGDIFLLEGQTDLAARIMEAVAGDPSSTPGSRAKAAYILKSLGRAVPEEGSAGLPPLSALTAEVLRLAEQASGNAGYSRETAALLAA